MINVAISLIYLYYLILDLYFYNWLLKLKVIEMGICLSARAATASVIFFLTNEKINHQKIQ